MPQKKPTAILSFGTLHGGMEMDAFRLAKVLCDSMDVTLIAKHGSYLDENYRKKAEELGIRFESVKFKHFFSPSIIFGVRHIVKKYDIQNVIFFGASEMRSLYFSFLGMDINLIIRHGMKKTTPKKDPLHRLVYSQVNWHVAICKFIADNVREIIPFGKKAKETIIYSALRYLPEDLPTPTIRSGSPVRLLHVARVAPDKGQVDAIKACRVLFDENIPFELHIVGDIFPPFEKRFRSVVSSVPYQDSIIVHGFSDNVPDFFRASDIFIYPSGGEGLSNSFIEALAYGLICIAYNNTSFPELRDLGFNYFIAEHHDLNDLEQKLMQAIAFLKENKVPVLENVELAKKMFDTQREKEEFFEILR